MPAFSTDKEQVKPSKWISSVLSELTLQVLFTRERGSLRTLLLDSEKLSGKDGAGLALPLPST